MSTTFTPPFPGLTHRSRILTNSAAEFLELRGDNALGAELAELSPEFVPEFDQFVPHDSVPPPDYFSESQEKLKKFKETLAAFQKNLIERKVDERYEIEIKDANKYTLADVLKVAQTVQEKHKDADKVHGCMGRIKKFFRATGRNASTYKKLLEFVPDDIYGSVICGGFTVILGTLERLETLRTDMYSALGSIPKTMHKIHDLLDVHYKSPRLRFCGDSVLVAIFVLLELIIRELSGSLGKKILKAPFKGEKYGSQIEKAKEALEEAVKDFESEAKICDAQRLGRVDAVTKSTLANTACIDATTKKTEQEVHQISRGLSNMMSLQEKVVTKLRDDQAVVTEKLIESTQKLDGLQKAETDRQKQVVQVHNNVYYLLTASPHFDSKTGKLIQNYSQGHLESPAMPTSPGDKVPSNAKPFSDENRSTLKKWKKISGNAEIVAAGDLQECLSDFEAQCPHTQLNGVAYIVASDRVQELLSSTKSKLLLVDIRTHRGEYTAASYAVAVLIDAIMLTSKFPVLYHFCSKRSSDPENDQLCGTTGLFVSLIEQLLVYLSHGNELDLEFLNKARRQLKGAKHETRTLRRAFKKLVQLLPPSNCLYIFVDSCWRYDSNIDGNGEIKTLVNLVTKESIQVKLVVTELSSLRILESMKAREERAARKSKNGTKIARESCIFTLEVPDDVNDSRFENTAWVKEKVTTMVSECISSQANFESNGANTVGDSSTDGTGSEDNSE